MLSWVVAFADDERAGVVAPSFIAVAAAAAADSATAAARGDVQDDMVWELPKSGVASVGPSSFPRINHKLRFGVHRAI